MRRPLVAAVIAAVFAAVAAPSVLEAQRRPDPAALQQEVERIAKELAELREQVVQVPTLATAVQELSERVAALTQELDQVRREHVAMPQAVDAIDRLSARADALDREVGLLRAKVADLEQPWAPASSGGGVAYKNGFALETADGSYALRLEGYAHLRYQLELIEDTDDTVDLSTFRVRRARFGGRGHLGSERLQYKFLAELFAERPLLDFTGEYRIVDALWVRFGQDKVPYLRSHIMSSTRMAFPDRSAAVEAFRYARDIGVWLRGDVGRVRYVAGVSNGAGENRLNDNIDGLFVGRVDVALLGPLLGYDDVDLARSTEPQLTAGLGATHDLSRVPATLGGVALDDLDVDDDGDPDNIRVVSGSADLTFRFRGFEASVEAMMRRESWGTILQGNPSYAALVGADADRTYWAGYALASYLVTDDVAVAARVGAGDLPFLGVGGRSAGDPAIDSMWQLDLLAQLYRRGARFLGLQYSLLDLSGRDAADDERVHRLILEAQVRF